MVRITRMAAVSLAAAMLAGCGGTAAKQGIDVSGAATLDGQPLEIGMVVFQPEDGGESASSQITSDGTFKLYSVKPGKYRAAVKTSMFAGMVAGQAPKVAGKTVTRREEKGKFLPVPAKYEDPKTSGLTVEIQPGKQVTLELKSRG